MAYRPSSSPPTAASGSARPPRYGQWIGTPADSIRIADFRDSDGDKVDDRYQSGPGEPKQDTGPSRQPSGPKGLIGRLGNASNSGTPDMSVYSPVSSSFAPKRPGPPQRAPSYQPPPPGSRPSGEAIRQASQYIRDMRGVDPSSYTDEQIRLLNEAYRNSRISHAPSYYRNETGQVVQRRNGQAGSSETVHGQPARPPANQFQPGFFSRSQNFDGSFTEQPNYALRDAFANNINQAMFPYYANSGTYLGEGAPPDSWGQAPSFDFDKMLARSREMVSDGWTNPFLGKMAQSPLAGLFGQ